MKKIIILLMIISIATSCGLIDSVWEEQERSKPAEKPIVPKIEVGIERPSKEKSIARVGIKPIIYYSKETRQIGLNKQARDMFDSGEWVIHIQKGYTYDVLSTSDRGESISIQQVEFIPPGISHVVIGLYNPTIGKYAVSVRIDI